MSRCFPFPPPGYEKKLRVEDVTLLAKEKDKEKRHKKDKDKDKKEGKVKSKERRNEKDKEKHRHKDKDKKNEKKRSREEKKSDGNRPTVEKVGSNSPENSCAQELEKRINFVDGATRSQTVHTIYGRDDGKDNIFDGVAIRSNGAYKTEAKGGVDQIANGQRDNLPSKIPKIVFSNGPEQRTVHISRPMENNNINTSNEGKDMQQHHSNSRKGERSTSKICNPETFGSNGAQFVLPRESAIVKELDRRVKDENGATGSQSGGKVNVTIQKRAEYSGKLANGNVLSFSQLKENPKIGNVNNQSKVPKVAIVHNFETEERGCEEAGDVGTSKNSPLEGMERSRYVGKNDIGGRMKIQSKDKDRDKPRKAERVKEESGNVVKLSRIGHNGSDSTDSNKHFTFKLSNKPSEVITGKRKEPEANGILHGNEIRPSKYQRTVVSPQLSTENGRNFKTATTITLPASKQVTASGLKVDGEEHRSNCTVKAMGPTPGNETRPGKLQRNIASQASTVSGRNFKTSTTFTLPASKQLPANDLKLDGEGHQSNCTINPMGPTTGNETRPSKWKRTIVSPQPSPENGRHLKTSTTNTMLASNQVPPGGLKLDGDDYKSNWTVGGQSPPVPKKSPSAGVKPVIPAPGQSPLGQSSLGLGKPFTSDSVKPISTKPVSTSAKASGAAGAHGSPSGLTKPPVSVGKVHGRTSSQESHLGSMKPPLTVGKVNGTVKTHGPPITTEDMPHIDKAPESVSFQGFAKSPLGPGEVNGSVGAHESTPVTKKHSSSSRKEKRKDKSSSKPVPPHPDTKYLSQILSVPKMEELSEFDDQGWLFESKNCSSKERDNGGEQVWAKAVHIESADIYALPYVIPY